MNVPKRADVYAKGEGEKLFVPYCETEAAGELIIHIERAEKGSRFDLSTRAAWAIYWNRPRLVHFLKNQPLASEHVLKDYLFAFLGCTEMIACLRARAIIDDKFTEPFMFLAASNELDEWSVLDLAPVVDMFVAAAKTGIADGSTWMDESWDIFDGVTHDAYIAWKTKRANTTAPGVKGKNVAQRDVPQHAAVQMVRAELYNPTDEDNKATTELCKAALEVWLTGMLKTLTEGNGALYMTGGEYGVDKQTALMKEHFKGTYRNTDIPCESYFGLLKYNKKLFTNMSVEAADALTMAQRNGLFSVLAPLVTVSRKSNRES